jgi:hypothetical protein
MRKSKQVQSIALGVAMLVTGIAAAAINISVLTQAQELTSYQLEVLPLLSNAGDLPVETPPSP